jgi:predicted ester cyclase
MPDPETTRQPADGPAQVQADAAASDGLDACKLRSRRLYEEVFGTGNYAAADELMAPDIVNHGPGRPPVAGTDDIKQDAAMLRTAFPDFRVTLDDQFGEDDKVVIRWTASGTHTGPLTLPTGPVTPTGSPISFEEIRIDRHSDAKIAESWFMPDRLTIWAELGLLPPRGTPTQSPHKAGP